MKALLHGLRIIGLFLIAFSWFLAPATYMVVMELRPQSIPEFLLELALAFGVAIAAIFGFCLILWAVEELGKQL